jgi:hypothetical protein
MAVALNAIIAKAVGRFNIADLPLLPARPDSMRLAEPMIPQARREGNAGGTASMPVRSFRQYNRDFRESFHGRQ